MGRMVCKLINFQATPETRCGYKALGYPLEIFTRQPNEGVGDLIVVECVRMRQCCKIRLSFLQTDKGGLDKEFYVPVSVSVSRDLREIISFSQS